MKALVGSAVALAAVVLYCAQADPLCDDASQSAYVFQRSKCLAMTTSRNTDPTGFCAETSCRDALSLAEALIPCREIATELPTIHVGGATGTREPIRMAFCSAECTDLYRQMQSALVVCQTTGKSSAGSCQGCQRYLRLVPTVVGACQLNTTTAPSSFRAAVESDMRQCEVIVRSSATDVDDGASTSISPFLISGLAGGVLVLVLVLFILKRQHRLTNELQTTTCRKYGGHPKQQSLTNYPATVPNDIRYDSAMAEFWHPQNKLSHITLRSKGGYGMVYSARLDTPERGKVHVAMKQLLPSRAQDIDIIEQFMHEIRLASTLAHPNIVPFIGFTWSNLQDISMLTEYMAHGDLYRFLRSEFKKPVAKRSAMFSWQAASDGSHCTKLSIASNVIDAIAYLHGQTPHSIIHRDLKSKNILLNDAFVAHVTDFGVSRQSSSDALMTARVGTSAWIAPEVLRGERYTHQADLYSFGVLLAELDTLQEPYKDASLQPDVATMTPSKLATNIAHGKLRPALSKAAPRFIQAMASRCLAFDYTTRPSATQVAMELTSHVIQHHHRESLKMYPGGAELIVTKTPQTSHAAYAAL
ncbi:TKL protein kinase [Aphanomyces invadans]|uniref:TKL protein kinase n=1 Tax=Aphanomyces invadans TaxID=157072 RepID=A0A024TG23_9STRA|nr:TKL protein kinase [Aphanomyces invadans]ETV92934.1 TKL protein kinase [Aphanomyces invadans]|eukprot:XP_008878455.1 TKL protein kinase [Aphanomyces invadans]